MILEETGHRRVTGLQATLICGNTVLRWEYLPGSTLYLVWTQSREDVDSNGDFRFGKSMNNLFGVRPDNIFMIKLSYWL